MVNSNEQNGSEAFTISSPSSSPSTPNFEQHLQSRANDSLAYDDEVDSLAPDYYYEPHLPPAPIHHSPSLHSLSPSHHSNPAFSRSSTSNTLANDSLLYDSDIPPLPPLAAPQPRAGKGSLASLHAAAGLGLDYQVSYQPSFGGNDLENQHRDTSLNSNHLQVGGADSSLKERQAYRSATPVVHGESRFESPSPSPEKRQQHGIYPPSSILKNSQSTSQFSNYEKPASIRSVRPSGTAPNLQRLGFSDVKQQAKPTMSRRRKQIITLGITLGIIAIIAIVVPIAFVVNKNSTTAAAASSAAATATSTTKVSGGGTVFPGSSGSANVSDGIDLSAYYSSTNPLNPLASPTVMSIQSGTSGSTINSYVNGSAVAFTYTNTFDGYYYYDPTNPFAKGGKAQSWSPAIEEEWVWGRDIVRGVNLGGWLVPEPFIVPALFEQFPKTVDEYTLAEAMRAKGGAVYLESMMRNHYETFITEQDFAQIAQAGFNYLRIPIGYWAVETSDDEPYLEGVAWHYFVRAIGWARKYGLRIDLDLHALPGSQNGWNHSGKSGFVNWMYGIMGIANAQRTLSIHRTFAEFISQPQYSSVVTMLSLVNEVQADVVGLNALQTFYFQAYNTIRGVTGIGAGKGPIILAHEGMWGVAKFKDFLPGADRFALDQHPYLAFTLPNTDSWEAQWKKACGWGGGTNESQRDFGIVIGGEWSAAINDCGYWLGGVGSTPTFETIGSCDNYDQWWTWDDATKQNVKTMALSTMDALQNYMFWTWKIGNSTKLGYASSPYWHYKLGWEQGWFPSDPRAATGQCASLGVGGYQFEGQMPASATGGGDGQIPTSAVGNYSAFPPASLIMKTGTAATATVVLDATQVAMLPTYTQTGTPVTLTHSAVPTNIDPGNGWANAQDTAGAYVAVGGCTYPSAYSAGTAIPTAVCTGAA
ncbi:hypothetical protein QFC24_006241 [Naganishia onofrii]|uniref:Uncharacterized protein n=1 Tax=Naganishia onofrii TaxID=1851511 RepID=A0ACC2X6N4_9TREE|nr:hypothetical protein QFC24_006241 [Naganishia onofrii]